MMAPEMWDVVELYGHSRPGLAVYYHWLKKVFT